MCYSVALCLHLDSRPSLSGNWLTGRRSICKLAWLDLLCVMYQVHLARFAFISHVSRACQHISPFSRGTKKTFWVTNISQWSQIMVWHLICLYSMWNRLGDMIWRISELKVASNVENSRPESRASRISTVKGLCAGILRATIHINSNRDKQK